MDGVDCDKVSGWAFANSGGYANLDVYIIDELGLVSKAATIKANNASRSDVRAAYGNNPNIPLDCGFVWAIPDAYKHNQKLTIKVVPVNDNASIANSPLTTSGSCSKPVTTNPGGTGYPLFGSKFAAILNPSLFDVLTFVGEMQDMGILFSEEESVVLTSFPKLINFIRPDVYRTGQKPDIYKYFSGDIDITPLTGCTKKVAEKLTTGKIKSYYGKLIYDLYITPGATSNLTMQSANIPGNDGLFLAKGEDGNPFNSDLIKISPLIESASQEYIAAIIIHEFVHAVNTNISGGIDMWLNRNNRQHRDMFVNSVELMAKFCNYLGSPSKVTAENVG